MKEMSIDRIIERKLSILKRNSINMTVTWIYQMKEKEHGVKANRLNMKLNTDRLSKADEACRI